MFQTCLSMIYNGMQDFQKQYWPLFPSEMSEIMQMSHGSKYMHMKYQDPLQMSPLAICQITLSLWTKSVILYKPNTMLNDIRSPAFNTIHKLRWARYSSVASIWRMYPVFLFVCKVKNHYPSGAHLYKWCQDRFINTRSLTSHIHLQHITL